MKGDVRETEKREKGSGERGGVMGGYGKGGDEEEKRRRMGEAGKEGTGVPQKKPVKVGVKKRTSTSRKRGVMQ